MASFSPGSEAEEVARFYGYNNIPTTLMRGQTTLGGYSPEQRM